MLQVPIHLLADVYYVNLEGLRTGAPVQTPLTTEISFALWACRILPICRCVNPRSQLIPN